MIHVGIIDFHSVGNDAGNWPCTVLYCTRFYSFVHEVHVYLFTTTSTSTTVDVYDT